MYFLSLMSGEWACAIFIHIWSAFLVPHLWLVQTWVPFSWLYPQAHTRNNIRNILYYMLLTTGRLKLESTINKRVDHVINTITLTKRRNIFVNWSNFTTTINQSKLGGKSLNSFTRNTSGSSISCIIYGFSVTDCQSKQTNFDHNLWLWHLLEIQVI